MSQLLAIIYNGNETRFTDITNSKAIIDLAYPVGATFTSFNKDFVPNTAWAGTTWEKIAAGKYIGATDDANHVGVDVTAGLPEIEARFDAQGSGGGVETGAIRITRRGVHGAGSSQSANYANEIDFKASRCSAVYGKSNTVTPESIDAFIRTA